MKECFNDKKILIETDDDFIKLNTIISSLEGEIYTPSVTDLKY